MKELRLKTKEEISQIKVLPSDSWAVGDTAMVYKRNINDHLVTIWYINKTMIAQMGKVMWVRSLKGSNNYDLTDGKHNYHSSWFQPVDFIEKELFEI